MEKKFKKPAIKPEQRQDWLRRSENGETPPKIAERDEVDVRTVRKHLKEAIEEREAKEARTMVLRNAIERHYTDLCNFAERLDSQIQGLKPTSFNPRDDLLKESLHQHLPRSPIWKNLPQWDSLQLQIAEIKSEIGEKLESTIASDTRLNPMLSDGETAVVPGIIGVLAFQAEKWAQGFKGLNLHDDLISEPAEEGLVNLRYGFSRMGKVKQEHVAIIKEILEDFELRLKEWEEYLAFEKSYTDTNRVRRNMHDELSVIILRRVVRGRCRYCPI